MKKIGIALIMGVVMTAVVVLFSRLDSRIANAGETAKQVSTKKGWTSSQSGNVLYVWYIGKEKKHVTIYDAVKGTTRKVRFEDSVSSLEVLDPSQPPG